jgi:pimeloyl-ACP methyl ester carboxylesterase
MLRPRRGYASDEAGNFLLTLDGARTRHPAPGVTNRAPIASTTLPPNDVWILEAEANFDLPRTTNGGSRWRLITLGHPIETSWAQAVGLTCAGLRVARLSRWCGHQTVLITLDVSGADGAPVSAIDDGKGPATLIAHPGSSDASSWSQVAGLLTEEFRVVRIQRRIHASDAAIALPHTMATEATNVLAVASQLSRPLLVGHSSGAVAALEAALASPAAFAGLVLYEPPLATRSPIAGEAGARARAALNAGDPVAAMEIHMRDIVKVPEADVTARFALADARRQFARFAAAQIADNEAMDALGVGIDRYVALELPTMLIEGERSPAHLRQGLADLAATLPHAEIATLDGQDHIAHLTAPDRIASVIREFARRVWQ